MLRAMTEVASQEGAQNATVARVVARSGVSRRTFYDLFDDREDCFLAAFEDALGRVAERAVPAYAGGRPWQGRVRTALLAILAFLEDEPDLGRLLVVESLTAGPRAVEVLVGVVRGGEGDGKGNRGYGELALSAEGVVGAVLSVIHARLQRGETDRLAQLVNPLMGMIVLPYLGQAAARRERERPAPKVTPRPEPRRGDPLRDLDMRLTYRTMRVLEAIADDPGVSNRGVGLRADIADQGQISKLLSRLERLGLIGNTGEGHAKGEPNAWTLTPVGREVAQTIRIHTHEEKEAA
jgi:AcrR family transcriptional regulator